MQQVMLVLVAGFAVVGLILTIRSLRDYRRKRGSAYGFAGSTLMFISSLVWLMWMGLLGFSFSQAFMQPGMILLAALGLLAADFFEKRRQRRLGQPFAPRQPAEESAYLSPEEVTELKNQRLTEEIRRRNQTDDPDSKEW